MATALRARLLLGKRKGEMRSEKFEELRKIKERTARNEKDAKRLNRASSIITGAAVLLTIIACLDKIVLLVSYVLSYLH